jgi:hypothetical protein
LEVPVWDNVDSDVSDLVAPASDQMK